ncbi:MAG TPA: hypothetical protein DIW20_05700 [Rhodospirillaceae bacterium]|nr:hypothetical protein [Rhodospirillaceae bacterium]
MGVKALKALFSYWTIAAICAIASFTSIPIFEGTNTGEDTCIYTIEENANWHFSGKPCKLTSEGLGTLVVGYFFTFMLLFLIFGGSRAIVGKCLFEIQTYYKKIKHDETDA